MLGERFTSIHPMLTRNVATLSRSGLEMGQFDEIFRYQKKHINAPILHSRTSNVLVRGDMFSLGKRVRNK